MPSSTTSTDNKKVAPPLIEATATELVGVMYVIKSGDKAPLVLKDIVIFDEPPILIIPLVFPPLGGLIHSVS